MVNHIWFWLLVEAAGMTLLYMVVKHGSQFKNRTLDEVIPFLRKINHEQLEEFFNPARESERLRFVVNRHRDRRSRRVRLDLGREYLLCMVHNARIVYQWGRTEYKCLRSEPDAFNRQTGERITALCQASMLFYNCGLLTLAEISFWLLISSIPWLPVSIPSAAEFRKFGRLDLLDAYEKVRSAAAELALAFGEEEAGEILQLM